MPNNPRSAYSGSGTEPPLYTARRITDGVLARRVIAYLLDLCFIGIISAILFLPLVLLTLLTFTLIHFYLLLALVPLAYATIQIGGPAAATWGMRIMDIGYRRSDGGGPSHVEALIVTLLFYASMALTFWIALLVPLISDRHRMLHDLLCGLVMVRTDGESWGF
jgi:uncharacterized RDD family membrane protein YckC